MVCDIVDCRASLRQRRVCFVDDDLRGGDLGALAGAVGWVAVIELVAIGFDNVARLATHSRFPFVTHGGQMPHGIGSGESLGRAHGCSSTQARRTSYLS